MNNEGKTNSVFIESEEEYLSEGEDEKLQKQSLTKKNNSLINMINKSNNLTQLIGYTLNNNNTILKSNINKENLKEYNYSKWLNWNENSCRYDSIFLYIAMHYYQY